MENSMINPPDDWDPPMTMEDDFSEEQWLEWLFNEFVFYFEVLLDSAPAFTHAELSEYGGAR